ncbi:probable protein phosphatase 2C T23F11.1 isoform X2 [Eurytemora carolleeae]|uniref:probable protein phosphatase 2C T23F11.1 isoform X2 n=1 Tax=Eurytemora carolleeae TaxID=1294199 RepID=UPI000C777AB3|nr:probable protein phosphatase 2C T23F11.1 isoform X2 [Eurytemora carolleeae]|eukprot:XP_023330650.1 probable protein phosphatase 2C T23F11.1 isoform X2 [Eurytemora affinis]
MAKQSGSRWHRLLTTFKSKNKDGTNSNIDSSSQKHSHNCSNNGLRVGVSNMKGYKKSNQDRCTAFSYLEGDPDLAFFAVYDGHGGTGVANYLKDHLHQFILSQAEYREGDIPEAILKGFLAVDSELKTYGNATELTGSTATCVLIKHGDILVANLGDSRAVASVGGLVKQITQDHNTSNPRERERVTAMGGVIKDNRVGGVLIPTRSFGDFLLKSEPDKPPWKQVALNLQKFCK